MKTYFDYKFKQWCTEEQNGTITQAAWADTEEESINRFFERYGR